MSDKKHVSRRDFLKKGALLGAAVSIPGVLAACGDATPTASTATTSAATTSAAATTTASTTSAATTAATTTNAATTTAAVTTSGAATTAASGAVVKGEIAMWDTFVTQGPSIDKALQTFMQANPGLNVKRTVQAGDKYYDLLVLAQKGDNLPDIFSVIPGNNLTEQDLITNGWIYDLTQFPDWTDFKKTFPNNDLIFYNPINNGKVYSAPLSGDAGTMWYQMWVNTKVFKDAGIVDGSGNAKIPETAEDVLAAAQQIKAKSNGKVYGWGLGAKEDFPWTLQAQIGQLSGVYGYDGFDHRTGKFTYSTNPVYKNVADFLLKLRDGNHILPDSGSVGDEALRALFAQGKFGMMLNGTWSIAGWGKTNPDFKDYTVTHVPFIGTNTVKSYFLTYKNGGSLYYINAKTKNLQAAWKTFKYIYSEPFGEEYVKGGNGDSIFPEANKPEYLDATLVLKTYYTIAPQYIKIGPDPSRKNPEWAKVKITPVNPTFGNVLQGLFTGQIQPGDLDKTFKDMDDARTKAYDQAVKDAQAAGAKVTLDDYIFPDWDPTKDYDNTKFIKK